MAAPVIRVRAVTKTFGKTRAVDDVSFDVPANSIFGLVGPNGAGKTTLFSVIAGFLKPTAGSVDVLGIDVSDISELQGRLAILPQDAQFQANVPILDQLIFFCELTGYNKEEAREEAFHALKIVGLEESTRKNARVLSHGMSKRLGIAQAFLCNPEVILLDEPTAGLDPANARSIRELVRKLQKSATVVISSHNLAELEKLCSHVAIMDKGMLIESTDVGELTQAGRQVRMTFARPLTADEIKAVRGVSGVVKLERNEETEYAVHTDPAGSKRTQDEIVAEIVQLLVKNGLVPRSVEEGASLEARFLEVTGDGPKKRRRETYGDDEDREGYYRD